MGGLRQLKVRRDRPFQSSNRNPQYRPRPWPGDGGGSGPAFRGLGPDHPQGSERSLRSPLADPTHGGAIITSGVENLAYEARRHVAARKRRRSSAAAAELIPNGCSLFINIGTTTEEVASALTSHEDLLVITNNLNVAMLLYRHPRIEVIVAGGAVRRADGAVIGSTAISLIGQFKVDYAIIGASAIDEDGALLDFDYREVQATQPSSAMRAMSCWSRTPRSSPHRPGPHRRPLRSTSSSPTPRCRQGSPGVCQARGIQVIEAMPKAAADVDEPGVEPASAAAGRG